MKILALSLLLISASFFITKSANAGNCDHSWQSASDGSNCGARAADQRPGGRP
jgi:hypothetical protein